MTAFRYDEDHFLDLLSKANTQEEIDAVDALWKAAEQAQLLAATRDLRKHSVKMLGLISDILGHVDQLAASSGFSNDPALADMRAEAGRIHAELHEAGGLKPAEDAHTPDPGGDEGVVEGATTRPLGSGPALETPETLEARDYASLADEYVAFFNGARIRPSHASKVSGMADAAWSNRARYQAIGSPLGIPWWFIAGLHQMESTYNFARHLHNGDPLSARTVRHPPGQPATGNPPFTFEQSATDALKAKGFDGLDDWSLPRALYRFERYNGFGYRQHRIASPYLWGFSTIHLRGKYVSDGVFDASATTQQCGTATLLRRLMDMGRLRLASRQFADLDGEAEAVAASATGGAPDVDAAAPAAHPFGAFWLANLSGIQHFQWREFLFKGASNAQHGTNTDPPASLYPNVVPLAKAMDAIRDRIGGRISFNSVYRSPGYNNDVGGAANSRHMKFDAADFRVIDAGRGSTGDWAAAARQLRSEGVFEGGIGIYNTFVHVDTRGTRADWDKRT